ncbi:MAG TPA: hypothetical protein V6D06_16985 [Trichocoleus sp.]
MFYWINEGRVSGYSDNQIPPGDWPEKFRLVEGPDLPISSLYWDGQSVKEIPPTPGPDHFWNGLEWEQTPPAAEPEPVADWRTFSDALGETPELLGAIATTTALFPALISRLKDLAAGRPWKGAEDSLVKLWNHAPPTLDESQRGALGKLAAAANIPLKVAKDNLLESVGIS